ncbi:MscS Mechanosensitive ion channel [uncultured Alphaproteobacteria bacterium]|uniref:MscS Mechanosensitive ion channel n=1 Tax=uncultured Alphaproteobacteria bacterium TaxID=91750 RepID=A0A212J2U1_9PROT|nr:MscS Mechanosensitive ion channel [uncultured Alphaproteobacteria bacterium]
MFARETRWFPILAAVLIGAAMLSAPLASAQDLTKPAAPAEETKPTDPLGRETPEGLVRGLVKAMAEQDYARAAQYLDLGKVPASRRATQGRAIAQDLQQILDQGGWIASGRDLSGAPEGNLDDNLPPERERFASVRTPQGTVDLYLQRTKGAADGPDIWLVSQASVAQIPDLLGRVKAGILERIIPETLTGPKLWGVPAAHWGALLAWAAISFIVASVVLLSIRSGLRRFWRDRPDSVRMRLLEAAVPPLRINVAVWIFALGGIYLGVAVVARQVFGFLAEVVGWIGLGWFLLRIIDVAATVVIAKVTERARVEALSAIRFFRRVAKFLVIAAVAIVILDAFGFNVSAGLAALGIGGIAIALGAQKTIENLVGSLTLIADHPIREGDFCQIGDKMGVIEDIGMRSTRVRTLDRTIVNVPNGMLSSMQIENFSVKDKFWFHPALSLRYETTPDQIRLILIEMRAALYAEPKIDPSIVRVRYTGLEADYLKIEVFTYILVKDMNEFLEIQEGLLLKFMDIVNTHGAGFAFPSQTVYLARDDKPQAEKARIAAEKMAALRGLPPDDGANETEAHDDGAQTGDTGETDTTPEESKGGALTTLFRRIKLRL